MTLEEKLNEISWIQDGSWHSERVILLSDALSICEQEIKDTKLKENKMWREWITVKGLTPINLADIDERIKELNESKK